VNVSSILYGTCAVTSHDIIQLYDGKTSKVKLCSSLYLFQCSLSSIKRSSMLTQLQGCRANMWTGVTRVKVQARPPPGPFACPRRNDPPAHEPPLPGVLEALATTANGREGVLDRHTQLFSARPRCIRLYFPAPCGLDPTRRNASLVPGKPLSASQPTRNNIRRVSIGLSSCSDPTNGCEGVRHRRQPSPLRAFCELG
jgi:hypothetical protein